jgi:hypothetical protein
MPFSKTEKQFASKIHTCLLEWNSGLKIKGKMGLGDQTDNTYEEETGVIPEGTSEDYYMWVVDVEEVILKDEINFKMNENIERYNALEINKWNFPDTITDLQTNTIIWDKSKDLIED